MNAHTENDLLGPQQFDSHSVKRFAIVLLALISGCKPGSPPVDDLASPSQATRDAAAVILRARAEPPSKFKWVFRAAFLNQGEAQTNVFKWLNSYNVSTNPVSGFGGLGEYREYQLDDYWKLGCTFENNDEERRLEKWKLISGWRVYPVWPSTNFSGTWINYYANGQKFTEGTYTNGLRSGECITFGSNGETNSIFHYNAGRAEGLWTQYYPSGGIQVMGLYSNGSRTGDVVWYYENGTKKTVEHYDDGRRNGPRITFSLSGKIESQRQYSNGVPAESEIRFNEDGSIK